MDENTYLNALEDAHRERVKSFCYAPVVLDNVRHWRLAIVERGVSGYFPISEDWFLGTETEMKETAIRLNQERLNLTANQVAEIVISSMQSGFRH